MTFSYQKYLKDGLGITITQNLETQQNSSFISILPLEVTQDQQIIFQKYRFLKKSCCGKEML